MEKMLSEIEGREDWKKQFNQCQAAKLGEIGNCTWVEWVSFCIVNFMLSCCAMHIQIALHAILLFICYVHKFKKTVNIDDLQ